MTERTFSPSRMVAHWWSLIQGADRPGGAVNLRRSRPAPSRLSLETLEDRCVPAVINVTSLLDSLTPVNGQMTLRSAIQAANASPGDDTINLTTAGVYQITLANVNGVGEDANATGDFDILAGGGNLSIVNTSGGAVRVDGGGLDRVFDVNPTFDFNNPNATAKFKVTMTGFTITGGLAFANNFDPNAVFPAQNSAPGVSGGGIRDVGTASLTLNNMVVTNNISQSDGGGIVMEDVNSTPWTLRLVNSTVSNNRSGDAGGGIDTDGSGLVVVTNSVVTGNVCPNQGAGIWLDAVQVGTVFQSAILNVDQSLISYNVGNAADQFGGGIGNAGDNTFRDTAGNIVPTAAGDPGKGATTITNSAIVGNSTAGAGGGFGDENGQGTLVVVNSTFANNSSVNNGGGLFTNGPTTTINDSTITGNAALANGGGVAIGSATFTLNNTVIASNFAGPTNYTGGMAPDILATNGMGNGNFIGFDDGNQTGLVAGTNFNQIGTVVPVAPLMGPLQNNGGALAGAPGAAVTVPSRVPLPGSPLLDKGVNQFAVDGTGAALGADQRGFLRLLNTTVDIGSVEFQPPATLTFLSSSANPARLGQPISFTALVAAQTPGSNPVTGTVTFSTTTRNGMVVMLGTAPLSNGSSVLNLPTGTGLVLGKNVVTATYSGDGNFNPSMQTLNLTTTMPVGVDIKGQPGNTTVGQKISPAVRVAVVDAQGNPITNDSLTLVTLAIKSGPTGAKLGGTLTVQAVNGWATFSDLTLNLAGTCTLKTTSAKLTPDVSNTFVVAPMNVTGSLKVSRSAITASKNSLWQQTVTLTNTSGKTLSGPLALLVKGLPAGDRLVNAGHTYQGSPYVEVLGSGATLAPGKSVTVSLLFGYPGRRGPRAADGAYQIELLLGV